MEARKYFKDYAGEYEDCMEVLEKELPVYKEPDPNSFKPKVTGKQFKKVISLFGDDDEETFFDVDKHYVGMPEYDNEDIKPYGQVVVKFLTEADMIAFGNYIGKTITPRTPSFFYPLTGVVSSKDEVWVDESFLTEEADAN